MAYDSGFPIYAPGYGPSPKPKYFPGTNIPIAGYEHYLGTKVPPGSYTKPTSPGTIFTPQKRILIPTVTPTLMFTKKVTAPGYGPPPTPAMPTKTDWGGVVKKIGTGVSDFFKGFYGGDSGGSYPPFPGQDPSWLDAQSQSQNQNHTLLLIAGALLVLSLTKRRDS